MNYSKFIDDLYKNGIKHNLKVIIGTEEYITNDYTAKLQNVQSGEDLTTDEIIDKYSYKSVEIPRDDSKMILTYRGDIAIKIESYFKHLSYPRISAVKNFHYDHLHLFNTAKGSSHNHQCWEGGYRDHLTQCLYLADDLHAVLHVKYFSFDSVVIVLYFHDIEKMFKYGSVPVTDFDKDKFLYSTLKEQYGIEFTEDEKNALKYIHGEGTEYRKDKRVMNELAAFCHSIDILSARLFWDVKNPKDMYR